MKRIKILLTMVVLMSTNLYAQDIKVMTFERNITSLIASMDPVYDNAGEACAVVRFFVRDEGFEIEPNLGVLKRENKTGEIRLWVPIGTKRLTVRHQGAMPLSGYEIPVALEPKVTYDATLEITEAKKPQIASNIRFFVGAGYNVLSISGPSVTLGLGISSHIVEIGAVFGLNKTDDWYFYNKAGDVMAAYNYNAMRFSLRYGYELKAAESFSIIPQIGATYNSMTGDGVGSMVQNGTYKSASSISALIGAKFALALSKNFALQLTPEYDFGISKDNVCKLVSDNDTTFKSWTVGFNLNVGLMIYF